MTTFHLAGFPRVGAKRELKFAQERYWRGEIAEADLIKIITLFCCIFLTEP